MKTTLALIVLACCLLPAFAAEGPLPHFTWRSKDVATGGKPDGEAAFKELAAQGIKTVVNVDGSQPDLAAAKKYGLRYIHLPIGYDEFSTDDLATMRRLADEVKGKLYIHCHHGKHRGPAYAAALLRMEGKITPEEARKLLEDAGTSTDYPGLWFSGIEQPLGEIEPCAAPLSESRKTSSMVEGMVLIDDAYELVKRYFEGGMKPMEKHPDFELTSFSMKVLHEMEVTREFPESKDLKFKELLEISIDASRALVAASEKGTTDELPEHYKRVKESCVKCHKVYRNPPLK